MKEFKQVPQILNNLVLGKTRSERYLPAGMRSVFFSTRYCGLNANVGPPPERKFCTAVSYKAAIENGKMLNIQYGINTAVTRY